MRLYVSTVILGLAGKPKIVLPARSTLLKYSAVPIHQVPEPGDDAVFARFTCSKGNKGNQLWAGIADGVGGWSESGVSPALFSHSLMLHAHRLSAELDQGHTQQEPLALLERAYEALSKDEGVKAGGSTALLARFDFGSSSASVTGWNLGDSGMVLLSQRSQEEQRKEQTEDGPRSKVVFQTQSQQHYFNCPFQLSKHPSPPSASMIVDLPSSGSAFTHSLKPNDIVLLLTDGVLDNLFPGDLETILGYVMEESWMGVQGERWWDRPAEFGRRIALAVVQYASAVSFDRKRTSPFTVEAMRAGMQEKEAKGGKPDDCAVVCVVCSEVEGDRSALEIEEQKEGLKAKL